MAKITIEYRYKGSEKKNGRRNTSEMRYYLEGLVDDMRSAGISAEYIDSIASDGERNSVTINGKDVSEILKGLEIKMLESDDCDPAMGPNMVRFGRPTTDWDREYAEDIPDVLMKNAISKAYADANKNDE
ncbi:MAG: hypothetical protein FWG58_04885 [Methanomassiliicoccaceae archaeon]|nr:hypothetical protein [Methanomassiliicoccaceae archaeon]